MNRFILNETSYHGSGAVTAVVDEIKNRGFKKAFVASDPGLVKFGVSAKVTDLLEKAEIPYTLYSDIKANPTIENVQNGVKAFKDSGADCIVAIGGGSSMDTSKAIGIIVTNPEFSDVRSLEGVAPTKNPCVPIIAVPTTAGTAAEVTINYVITDVEKKRKFVCVDAHDIPVVAVVDPDMMNSMPAALTAATGMDALTHAIEGYITKAAWELSDMFHIKAIEIIAKSLRGAVKNEKEGREGMALGQYVAGMGFSNVGLGVDHSIAKAMGVEGTENMSPEEYRAAAVNAVKQLSEDVGIPTTLKGIVKEQDIDALAKDAYADACRPGNPRETSVEDIKELYRSLLV